MAPIATISNNGNIGNNGLGVHQAGAAKVDNATVEDLRTALEPDRLGSIEAGLLSIYVQSYVQGLGGKHINNAKHGPAAVHGHSLTVRLKTLRG